MTTKNDVNLPELLEKLTAIAVKNLLLDEAGTLETRKWDTHDFHTCSVWGIKEALLEAYELGRHPNGSLAKSL